MSLHVGTVSVESCSLKAAGAGAAALRWISSQLQLEKFLVLTELRMKQRLCVPFGFLLVLPPYMFLLLSNVSVWHRNITAL